MYYTDDALYPENMKPLIISAAPYGPSWLPGDAPDIPVTWDEQVQAAVDCYNAGDSRLHQGLSLGSSKLEGKVVTCRGHGWRYDVTTGNSLHVPDYGVASYPVRVVDGKIMVALDVPPTE